MRLRGKRVISVTSLYLCPVDLRSCGRSDCLSAVCVNTGEPLLTPCRECGTLTHVRRSAICAGCLDVALSGIGED